MCTRARLILHAPHTHKCSHTRTHTHTHTRARTHAHACTHTYVHTFTHTYTHTHARTHTCTHTRTCTHTYAHVCVYSVSLTRNKQTHTHPHTHTYTHCRFWWRNTTPPQKCLPWARERKWNRRVRRCCFLVTFFFWEGIFFFLGCRERRCPLYRPPPRLFNTVYTMQHTAIHYITL